MYNAHIHIPLSAAVAAGVVARVAGSLTIEWLPGMAHRTASRPMNRGVMR
ncbi:MAG: hypothetical protein ABI886_06835 [Betaproteobacteria bacterium]